MVVMLIKEIWHFNSCHFCMLANNNLYRQISLILSFFLWISLTPLFWLWHRTMILSFLITRTQLWLVSLVGKTAINEQQTYWNCSENNLRYGRRISGTRRKYFCVLKGICKSAHTWFITFDVSCRHQKQMWANFTSVFILAIVMSDQKIHTW